MFNEPSPRLWWATLAVVLALLLFPLLLVDVPPLLDYPNHLARLFVLAFPNDPALSKIYGQRWSIAPNLAIDVLAPPLLRVLPVYVAGRLVIAVTLLVQVLGCVAYSRAAFGRRSLWPMASAIVAYNATFLLGFLNFQISLGLALLAGAGWCVWADRRPRATAFGGALCATAIFFCHIFGVLFLGVVIGAREAVSLWRIRRERAVAARRATLRGAMLACVFAPTIVLYLLAPLSNDHGPVKVLPWSVKLIWLFGGVAHYSLMIALLTALVLLAVLYALLSRRRLRVAAGVPLAALALFAAYLVTPSTAMSTAFLDTRFPIMLALLLFGGCAPRGLSRRAGALLFGVLGTLLLVRTAGIAGVWRSYGGDVAALRAVIAPVEPGARVIVASVDFRNNAAYWTTSRPGHYLPGFVPLDSHLGALLTIERKAFWPMLFTMRTKQPLRVLAPYDRIAVPQGKPPDIGLLADPSRVRPEDEAGYLADWPRDFDYVLLLDPMAAGTAAAVLPDRLTLLRVNAMAALYRVRRP
jgi:hypothetical protein